MNKEITSAADCTNAGGTSYFYCPETGIHYCSGVCGRQATCSSNEGIKYNACKDGPDSSSSNSSEYSKDDCFDLDYMNKRKVLIAISYKSGSNTYSNTENQCLGVVQKNEKSKDAYKPSSNNTLNDIYSSVFVYTSKRGGLAPNDIYKSCSNDVNFFPKWMLVEYQGSYFIKNLDNDRYLGYDNMNNKTEKKINGAVYMSPEKNENGKWALSSNNLWDIKQVNCNTYTIKHKGTGKYLSSTKPKSNINFVTNVYSDNEPVIKPDYNKYGDVYCDEQCFQWFIAPLPPYRGYWHSTVKGSDPAFLPGFEGNCGSTWWGGWNYCSWRRTQYPMRPCAPPQLGGKQLPYPWFQAMEGNSGVCLNAKSCAYSTSFLVWTRLRLTLTIGTGQYDGTSQLNGLYLTYNKKAITNSASFQGEDFKKGTSKSVEFMVGLKQPYANGLYITVGNDGVVITKIVLELYNNGYWQTILNDSQDRVWVKNQSHQFSFDQVTL